MVVNPAVPAKTVPEFIAYAKANPGKINMASAGNGSGPHMTGELFKMMAGVDMVHVPYRGGSPALTDLLAGQVQVYFGTMSGLIDMRPRKGAVVSKATPAEVESLFVAMAEMEATCARLAAMSMTPVERRRLQARHEAMIALAKARNTGAYSDANVAFHSAIYAGTHNAPLAEFTLGLRRRVGPFRRAQFQVAGRLVRSTQEHDAVVKAILGGDPAGAHAAMLHHVGLVEDAFEAFAADKKG